MVEDHKRLLAVLDVRIRDLMSLCDMKQQKINELELTLAQRESELQKATQAINDLNIKCDNMLTARVVSANEREIRSAKMRLSKLVREVDKCIALLNE